MDEKTNSEAPDDETENKQLQIQIGQPILRSPQVSPSKTTSTNTPVRSSSACSTSSAEPAHLESSPAPTHIESSETNSQKQNTQIQAQSQTATQTQTLTPPPVPVPAPTPVQSQAPSANAIPADSDSRTNTMIQDTTTADTIVQSTNSDELVLDKKVVDAVVLDKGKDFEAALSELEKIVGQLEGEIKLEDALRLFDRGMTLSQQCQECLHDAEQRIDILKKAINGSITSEKFNEESLQAV